MASNPKDPNFPGRRTDWSDVAIETRAIRAGQDPDPETGSVIVPIYQTSTFKHQALGSFNGYEYSRTDNPTRTALQSSLASLEGGAWGLAFASGTAATREIATLLNPGDHILMSNDAYGGTFRLFDSVFGRFGIETSCTDLSSLDAAREAVRPNTKLIWAETPTNPAMRITDIAGMKAIAEEAGAWLVVDNTFATPYLQQPLSLGADLVLHSTTKYLGGHSDVVGGAVVGNDSGLYERLKELQNGAGAIPGPFDCWLTLRGIKTLPIRMDRHSENGMRVAQFLDAHDAVETVFYPGLPDHPGHAIATTQMRSFGGMVSFALKGGKAAAQTVCESTRIFLLAESLGGVESLIEHPDTMTHASVSGTAQAVDVSVIRMSVGIENADDLIADLDQALARIG
ncbi:MAG TPA: cystathionine gamma-synthase [Thermomicrobiales bacterium]|nr:cystathionine gamma-synthase [Thermomicrobiales bacterium]